MKSSKLFHGENEINAFSTEHAAQAGIYVRRQMGSGSLTVLESLETEIENSNFLFKHLSVLKLNELHLLFVAMCFLPCLFRSNPYPY